MNAEAGEITSSYWDVKTAVQSDGGQGRKTKKMQQQATFKEWDFGELWSIKEGNSYPYFQRQEK